MGGEVGRVLRLSWAWFQTYNMESGKFYLQLCTGRVVLAMFRAAITFSSERQT